MQTTILIGLFFCHFLGDFSPLSTPWMIHAKQFGKPLLPILAHASIHGTLMFIFLLIFGIGYETSFQLLIMQVSSHFFIDVLKGRINGWFPKVQSPINKEHWILFGLDQYLHALVIIKMSVYCQGNV